MFYMTERKEAIINAFLAKANPKEHAAYSKRTTDKGRWQYAKGTLERWWKEGKRKKKALAKKKSRPRRWWLRAHERAMPRTQENDEAKSKFLNDLKRKWRNDQEE